jgi:uncharacterized membrane protein
MSWEALRENMNAVLFGLTTAVCWGCADFVARFTGRAVGPDVALAGMLVASAVLLTLLALVTSTPLIAALAEWPLILATGLAVMTATLLLYAGLARGPIGMVAPIAGAYPAFNVVIGLVAGIVPTGAQWIAILMVMAGVAVVARCAPAPEGEVAGDLRLTFVIALLSALGFALAISAARPPPVCTASSPSRRRPAGSAWPPRSPGWSAAAALSAWPRAGAGRSPLKGCSTGWLTSRCSPPHMARGRSSPPWSRRASRP